MTAPRSRRGSGVRISAGRWKGRRLDAPEGARPTSGRAREALFDLLGDRVAGSRVLDLYAGSGAVGLEAASRGASIAVLVERDADRLERTLSRLAASTAKVVVRRDEAPRAIEAMIRARERFDVIFADPPYERELDRALARIGDLLSPGGVFVLQRDAADDALEVPGLRHVRERAYGRNVFHFYEPD